LMTKHPVHRSASPPVAIRFLFSLDPMSRTFRASLKPYIVMTICIGIIPAGALPWALRGDTNATQIAAAGFVALLFAYFWLSRFRLTLTPSMLTYSSLFSKTRTIRFSDITASQVVWNTAAGYQFSCLHVTANSRTLRINHNVFSRDANRALFQLVGPNQELQPAAGRRENCNGEIRKQRTGF
jgi:hypothetical protein